MPTHECSYWTIESGEWAVDYDGGTVLLTAPDDSAFLRVLTVGAWAPPWQQLMTEARKRAPEGAKIEQVNCGEFSGLYFEGVASNGDYFRSWMLTLGELYLLVDYSCALQHRDRDRSSIDQILSTLRDNRP